MKMPTVSVILPNYNYAKYFADRLDEILAQSYKVSEIIILDDASTDVSLTCIKTKLALVEDANPEIKFITTFNKQNSGSVFSQWQKGIKLATSDYIWIAELDDSAEPTFLETAMEPVLKDANIVLSYTNSELFGSVSIKDRLRQIYDFSRRNHKPGAYVISGEDEVAKNLAVYNSIPNVSACVIKNSPELHDILEVSKGFKLSGDWAFYLILLKLGNLAYSPKRLNKHRLSKESVTNQTNLKERYDEIRKIHILASKIYKLPETTKKRIEKSERQLSASWGLDKN